MSGESSNGKNFTSYGSTVNLTLAANAYVSVENYVAVKMPTGINANVVTLGMNNQTTKIVSSVDGLDGNGVNWL